MRFFLFLIVILSWISCKSKPNNDLVNSKASLEEKSLTKDTQPDIDIATARQMLNASKDIILIDVRTAEEVENGKIDNALHIDFKQPDFKNKVDALDRNKEYIVYCAVGGRSSKAVALMHEMGFNKVHNMLGGYNQWKDIK